VDIFNINLQSIDVEITVRHHKFSLLFVVKAPSFIGLKSWGFDGHPLVHTFCIKMYERGGGHRPPPSMQSKHTKNNHVVNQEIDVRSQYP
jgi:hypothetical protein